MVQAMPAPGQVGFGTEADIPLAARPMPPARAPILPAVEPVPPSLALRVPLDRPPVAHGHSRLLPESPAQEHGAAAPPAHRQAPASRWSADGWLLLRHEGVSRPILADRPSYGRSQTGVVTRYAVAPGSAVQPRVHLRAASALSGQRERELAAGVSARPFPGVPVLAVAEVRAEVRAVEAGAGRHFRPAAYAVTELPPAALPLGLRAEAYVQGGYVGGDFATAFVDGQARTESLLTRVGEGALSAGAGAWGGAQRASSRLDVGPTASVTFQLGEMRGRLAADYRFRVAGTATPADGPTLTLSAGF
jgi:hypothetical protein